MKGRIIVILAILATSAVARAADNFSETERKIAALNAQAFDSLGISLTALLLLTDASPTGYFLRDYLIESGKMEALKQLEEKGYVRLEVVDQLPDGRKLGKHVRVIPTDLGYKAQDCIVRVAASRTQTLHPNSAVDK